MDEQRLSEIEARVNAATPGPWHQDADSPFHVIVAPLRDDGDGVWTEARPAQVGGRLTVQEDDGDPVDVEVKWYCYTEADAEFIARAREDVPSLIAEIRRLKAL